METTGRYMTMPGGLLFPLLFECTWACPQDLCFSSDLKACYELGDFCAIFLQQQRRTLEGDGALRDMAARSAIYALIFLVRCMMAALFLKHFGPHATNSQACHISRSPSRLRCWNSLTHPPSLCRRSSMMLANKMLCARRDVNSLSFLWPACDAWKRR